MKKIFLMIFVAGLLPTIGFADEPGYSDVPDVTTRGKINSGYKIFPHFPRLEIVKEDEGAPNPQLAPLILDSTLKAKIQAGHFSSLQVRDLFIRLGDIHIEANTIHFPFAVSVKHSRGSNTSPVNPDRGTIEVAGEILVHFDGTGLSVEVIKFDDSQWLERRGRSLGFNSEINLDFARAIVKPELEGYFNADSSRVQTLLDMATNIPRFKKP